MKLGHNNEKALVKNLLKDKNLIHNFLVFDLHEIYEVGIIINKKKTCMKTTTDFSVAMLTSTIRYMLFLVECKNRHTSSTEIETKGLVQKLGRKCACISWDDPLLSKVISFTHELVHCLHHETTCNLNCVLL